MGRHLATLARARRRISRSGASDVALAGALAVLGVVDALYGNDWPTPHAASAVFAALAAGFVSLRRRAPLVAYTGTVLCLCLTFIVLGHYQAGMSLLIAMVAMYSVAAHGTNVPLMLALSGLLIISTGSHEPVGNAIADMVFTTVALGLPFAFGMTARRLRSRENVLREGAVSLVAQQEELAERAASDAVARERVRIAGELHDIISHGLGVMILHAGVAEDVLERDRDLARTSLRLIRDAGQEAIGEMGRLVGLMRGAPQLGTDPQPTLADIDRLVTATRAAGLAVDMSTVGVARPLPAAVELSAYRVVQEALTNALKHAGPCSVRIALRYAPDGLEVEVCDDGSSVTQGAGSRQGLVGLRERVAVFGGGFRAGRLPTGGWAVSATFPAPP
jgi:signal transduction histidine kinase